MRENVILKLVVADDTGTQCEVVVFNRIAGEMCGAKFSAAELFRMKEVYHNTSPLQEYVTSLPRIDCTILVKPSKFSVKAGHDVVVWQAEIFDVHVA